MRDGRSGQGTRQKHLAAKSADARSDGCLEEVAREASVLADDDPRHVLHPLASLVRDGGPDAKGNLGGHVPAIG